MSQINLMMLTGSRIKHTGAVKVPAGSVEGPCWADLTQVDAVYTTLPYKLRVTDDKNINRLAAKHLRRRGPNAVHWLIEQAEIAEALGDHEAAGTWGEIALQAERLLMEERG